MPENNSVSVVIPPEVLTEVQTAVNMIKTKLQPYLVALTPEERHEIPKMSDKTVPFVEKTLNYAETSPEFAPPYMKVDEMKIDIVAVNNLKSILNPITQIESTIDDTVMISGSEAYVAALSYYNSVKLASKMDIPNAKPIYDDLKQRFTKSKPTTPEE